MSVTASLVRRVAACLGSGVVGVARTGDSRLLLLLADVTHLPLLKMASV